jgi:hypothetical protein
MPKMTDTERVPGFVPRALVVGGRLILKPDIEKVDS